MLVNKLHDKIWCYQSDSKEIKELIDLVEKDAKSANPENVILPWHEWYAMSGEIKYVFGYQKTIWNPSVDENVLNSSNSVLAQSLKKAKNFLIECSNHYADHFNFSKLSHSSINISKYIQGKQMGPHVDSNEDADSTAGISAILYLNDDYEGGELYFPKQQVTLKPKAGTVVVFPSNAPFLHQSLTIQNGSKYIMALFWNKNDDI